MSIEQVEAVVNSINAILFSSVTIYALLFSGVLFTIWTRFGQLRAMTHGVQVLRGKYDKPDDPGAINHFQALSAALSATVGLGNIGGVAVAIAIGGPGAVFWMWCIGVFGMALKMTEVTQSMLTRNLDDPENPHGGPMYVVVDGFKDWGLEAVGKFFAGVFCCAALMGAITGGNMFQAWNVAAVTNGYFNTVPREFVGLVLACVVGVVILGGIKRIGSVAGRLVPVMCVLYLMAGFYVIAINIADLPAAFALIVKAGLGFTDIPAQGAFLGAGIGSAFIWGVKRALFSSEAGWGSAPIAHAAARTDEPVREGIVAGLEPLIDTIIVCTVTALVIILSGAWNRPPEVTYPTSSEVRIEAGALISSPAPASEKGWNKGDGAFMILEGVEGKVRIDGEVTEVSTEGAASIQWDKVDGAGELQVIDRGVYFNYAGAALTAHAFDLVTPGLGMWLVLTASWLFALSTMISWSYYGEQGVYFLFRRFAWKNQAVIVYKLLYSALAFVATMSFIKTDRELDMWTTLGMGCMLVCNIPIMLLFGHKAMKQYHEYNRKLKAGEFPVHDAGSVVDIVEGK